MGFPTTHVVTEADMVHEFICPICCMLVEYPSHTSCSHVFCRSCLDEWLAQADAQSRCPKCNTHLANGQVADLKAANPLAFRILSAVRCRCPLPNCSWQGDYSEVFAHLTDAECHRGGGGHDGEVGLPSPQAQMTAADAFKAQGNEKFQQRAFKEAITLYTKAVDVAPGVASYYGNRAAAHMMLGNHRACVADCRQAIKRDPLSAKFYVRLVKALGELGEFREAENELSRALSANPNLSELADEHARVVERRMVFEDAVGSYERRDYNRAGALFHELLRVCSAPTLQIWAAKVDLGKGEVNRPIRSMLQVIRADDSNSGAYAVRGVALFLSGDMVQSVKHLREALRLNPDDQYAKEHFRMTRKAAEAVTEGRDAAAKRDFERAIDLLSEAIVVSAAPPKAPLGAILLSERGAAYLRLHKYNECLQDCNDAIEAQDDCKSAWISKASALIYLDRPEEALKDLESIVKVYENDSVVRHWYDKALFEVRRKARPDYYALLGVSSIASEVELKAAYKQRALECHPDMVPTEKKEEAEKQFKLMGEALAILGDPMKRKLYDEGHDRERIDERVQAAERAARQHPRH